MLSSQCTRSHNENLLLNQAIDKYSNTSFSEFPPGHFSHFYSSVVNVFLFPSPSLCVNTESNHFLFDVTENVVTDAGWHGLLIHEFKLI